ncbi:MAG: glutaredoxin family protein [Anaerolineae bacterium]|nr:glutaredoxin family protein [Anaerolineae bacterium]
MPEAQGSVPGSKNAHKVMLYAISTCGWCRRTRQFLEDQDVAFDYVYMDLIKGQEREAALEVVRRWNPATSFPTLVVDDAQAVVGYRVPDIQEVLGL